MDVYNKNMRVGDKLKKRSQKRTLGALCQRQF